MAKKKQVQASAVQLRAEGILGIAAFVLIFYHMFLSFARHFFSPENRISASQVTVTLQ